MKSRYMRTFAVAAGAALATSLVSAQQLVDLGEVTAHAINNDGQVALDQGIYSDGVITPLPALPASSTPAVPLAINASGSAVGYDSSYPIAYVDGALISFASTQFTSGGGMAQFNSGTGTGINSSGEVIGWYYDFAAGDGAPTIGMTYADGTLTLMTVMCPGKSIICTNVADNMPYGINDEGEITGTVRYDINDFGSSFDAYIYDNEVWTDLGPGAGYAINAAGQVTGDLEILGGVSGASLPTPTSTYAFLYTNGTTTNLGTLPGGKNSTGYAINKSGQIVGSSDCAGCSGTRAFFYNGAMYDLNTLIGATDPLKPYVTLTSGVGINDNLLIVANGIDSRTGKAHAYLYQASFVQFAPAALDFAMLPVGGTSEGQSVTVTNSGTTAIPMNAAYVNGDFSLRVDTCGTSLAPGAQCRVAVVFLPKVVGVLSGVLTIPAGGANYQVPLSGTAPITATISASRSTATVGQPVTLTWTISAGSACTATSNGSNARPPFTGTLSASGKQTLTDSAAGTVTYTLNCTAPGVAAVSVSASVVWNWLPVTATISASPSAIIAGNSTTLTWTSSNATSCAATGGGPDDGWTGTKATSGSQTIVEPFSLDVASVVLTFKVTCSSTISGLSDAASVNVTESQPGGSSAVSATIAASPTTITVGESTTLTWKSSNATSCTATGGSADDGWAGTKATSGSQTVTETAALTSPTTLTFGIACTSSDTAESGKASVNVMEGVAVANDVGPSKSSGGGGALNPLGLALLAGIFGLRGARAAYQNKII